MYRNHLSPPVFPYPWASDWGEDQYGLWMAITHKGVRYVFRWIMPGTFTMGSNKNNERASFSWENQHKVTLTKGFWLGETTVFQALWQVVINTNPSKFAGKHRPVENISWEDSHNFITAFNKIHPDFVVRLPWEAEWEYACRAGTQTMFNFGDKNDLTLDKVNYRGTWYFDLSKWGKGAQKRTAVSKTYPCNDWGLFEMHGNVWEWCEDAWQEHLGNRPVTDPWLSSPEPEAGADRVVRGGSWLNGGLDVRSAFRRRYGPGYRSGYFGLRLALGHSELQQGQASEAAV